MRQLGGSMIYSVGNCGPRSRRRMGEWRKLRPYRVLDFDIENRPLNYVSEDFTFSEITGIAWAFIGDKRRDIACYCLGEIVEHNRVITSQTMLLGFVAAYVSADLVTGHNIIKHDLRIINGALLEEGLSPLPPKMVCDT